MINTTYLGKFATRLETRYITVFTGTRVFMHSFVPYSNYFHQYCVDNRDFKIYRVSHKKVDPFKLKLAITYCINLNALILLCYGA